MWFGKKDLGVYSSESVVILRLRCIVARFEADALRSALPV